MHTDVDLPAPGLLWTRWATLAAALTGIGYPDVWFIDDRGAHHDDHGVRWARFGLLDGARSVLFGYDREHSSTADADPPIDLLTSGPGWLPWDELTALAEADELGFVVWHENGRWSRSPYREGLTDGLVHTVGAVLSGENALAELGEIITEWGRHDLRTPAERDDVRAASENLLAAAVRGEVAADRFERLLGRLTEPALDLRSALFAAGRGGITAGTRPARIPAGERPPMRRIRQLSQSQHDRLIWAAMHDAAERRRPTPADTAELDTLAEWMRRDARTSDRACTVLAYADATSARVHPRDHGSELGDLVRALRRAEADPRHGQWLFLRVETTADKVRVERRYDSWPPWWPDDGGWGPWRTNLTTEMAARAEDWQPTWMLLLDPAVAYRPAG